MKNFDWKKLLYSIIKYSLTATLGALSASFVGGCACFPTFNF